MSEPIFSYRGVRLETLTSPHLWEIVVEYLSSTYSLADEPAAVFFLKVFFSHSETGLLKGP